MSTIPASVIFPWDGNHADIPSGWTRETSLDSKYPKSYGDSVSPNTTGGASTHTHTSSSHSHTLASHTHTYTVSNYLHPGGSTDNANSGSGSAYSIQDQTHSHTGTSGARSGGTTSGTNVSYGAVSNDPPYYKVIFIKPTASGALPNDMIAYWNTASVPSNWYECDGNNSTPNLQGKYLKGASTSANSGGTGGSTTNLHDLTHTHSTTTHTHSNANTALSGDGPGETNNSSSNNLQSHSHTASFGSGTQGISSYSTTITTTETVEPVYHKLMAIQKKTGGIKKQGIIGMWLGETGDIPNGWLLCDGNDGTPNLRDKFIKIATGSGQLGDTGGSNTHSHSAVSHSHSSSGSHTHSVTTGIPLQAGVEDVGSTILVNDNQHYHSTTSNSITASYNSATTTGSSSSNQPAYRTVAYIQFDRDLIGGAVFFGLI